MRPPNASTQLRKESPEEGSQHFAGELRVVGAAVAERVGEREHPLANGHSGPHAVDEVCRRVGHPAAAAGGAEASPFAREGHEALELAVVAAQPEESVSEDATADEGAQLLADEVRDAAIAVAVEEAR